MEFMEGFNGEHGVELVKVDTAVLVIVKSIHELFPELLGDFQLRDESLFVEVRKAQKEFSRR